jgi:hypothetical protein
MLAHRLTGSINVAPKADSLKASNHAGSTGLTGLTGVAGAHTSESSSPPFPKRSLNKLSVCVEKTMLTLLTLNKASIHAGFIVTGFHLNAVMACKGA